MKYAPVVVFVYKRLDKTKICLEALSENIYAEVTDMYIFSDGFKGKGDREAVEEVREYIRKFSKKSRFKSVNIIEREKNLGLANSIISGVTHVISLYGKVIVVEDDLITSKDFLQYMNDALKFYEKNENVGEISAYTYPLKGLEKYNEDIYMTRKAECWGWGTWEDRWKMADWDMLSYHDFKKNGREKEFEKLQKGINKMLRMQLKGKLDSWAVRWCYSLFVNNKLTVYPKMSRTVNIGFDGSGSHCGITTMYGSDINTNENACRFKNLDINMELEREAAVFEYISFQQKIRNFLKTRVNKYTSLSRLDK